jgi:hypothetical protein
MDWDWKKLFSDPRTVAALFAGGLIGLVIGTINGVIQKRHGGWPAFFAAICTGVGVAMIVNVGISEYIKSETARIAIVAVCAIISDDIWAGFKTLGVGFRKNPLDSVFRVLDALRGRPSAPPTDTTALSPKED